MGGPSLVPARGWGRSQSQSAGALGGVAIGVVLGCAMSFFLLGPGAMKGVLSRPTSNRRRVDSDNGEDNEEVVDVSAAVLVIFLLLVALTIGFDVAKEYLEEKSGRHMRPIIEALFGELTVLGFLSALTFVLSEVGFFRAVGGALAAGGDAAKEELSEDLFEIFELVHFCLFSVMVVFVVQVLEDVRQSMKTAEEWMDVDRKCRDPEYVRELLRRREEEQTKSGWFRSKLWRCLAPYILFLPQLRNSVNESLDDKILFYGLRQEFIKERSVEPPFRPADPKNRVNVNFNFGRYLSVCLGMKMAHVVDIEPITWTCLALFGSFLFCILLVIDGDLKVMSWIWVGIGFLVFFFNVFFESRLINIRKAFTPPVTLDTINAICDAKDEDEDENKVPLDETCSGLGVQDPDPPSPQRAGSAKGEAFPDWCFIDLEQYERRRSWFVRWLAGKVVPNRHHALFWLEHRGPANHVLILRINLVFNGLYCAMLALVFLPAMYRVHGRSDNFHFFLIYVLLAAIPILSILFNKKHLILTLVQVGSIGTFRLPQAVARAQREDWSEQVVRRLVVVHKLHLAARGRGFVARGGGAGAGLSRETIVDMSRIFDIFDRNGDGIVSGERFQRLLGEMGTPMTAAQVRNFLEVVGSAEVGGVTKDSFLHWYANQVGRDNAHMIEYCALYIFGLIDQDGSGTVSANEFKAFLDNLHLGFSIDEVGEIVDELDFNNDGFVSMEEFHLLLEKHYPRELESCNNSWRKMALRRISRQLSF